jgi:short-subunit dehydrogenase
MTNSLFKNKIVVVTGGGTTFGKSLARELVFQKADVVLVGNKKEDLLKFIKELELVKKKIGRVFAVVGDMSTKEGCEAVLRDIKKVAGTFEILINNSCIMSAGKFEDVKLDEIKKVIDTNVTGTILLTKLALPIIRSNKKPGIINISTFEGKVGVPFFTTFSASQYAINGFTEALQREFAGDTLRIMSVTTAGIKTEENEGAAQKLGKIGFSYESPDEVSRKIIEAYNGLRKELVLGKKERGLIFWNSITKKSIDNKFKKIKTKILNAIAEL